MGTDQPGSQGQSEVTENTRIGAPAADLADRLGSEFLSEIAHRLAHDIGNPLTAIISFASIVERVDPGAPPELLQSVVPKLAGYGRSLTEEAWKVSVLNDRMVMLFSRRAPLISSVNLAELAERGVRRVRTRTNFPQIEIMSNAGVSEPLHVSADGEQLIIALTELLLNALQASAAVHERAKVSSPISLFVRRRGEQGIILVRNDTTPVTIPELNSVFEPFVTGTTERKQLGLGLSVAAAVAQRTGGSLRVVEEREGGNVTFLAELAFPLVS